MDKLHEEISIEKEYIEKTLKLLDEALNRPDKSEIELSAIGSFSHHCYTGMENILSRILKFKKIKNSRFSFLAQRFVRYCGT